MSCGKNCETECGSCETDNLPEEVKQMRKVLETVNSNREKGLKTLDNKVQDLLNSEVINVDKMGNAHLVSTLRDLSSGLNAALQVTEAENQLLDMVINDLGGLSQKLEAVIQNHFITGSHLQTLMALLINKGLLTEDELRQTWERMQAEFKQQTGQT
jgi:hypothetical protein